MVLYERDNIKVTTIDKEDINKVLSYFSENDFNCDYESGALRPSDEQFKKIMMNIVSGKDDENNIFVLKKNDVVVGYISMFVEYDRMKIGHIAVDKTERNKGYGKLLTEIAINVAENEGRDVSLFCLYPNSYLKKLGFESQDNINYFRKRKENKNESTTKLFVSVDEYRKRMDKKLKSEVDSFKSFLDSDIMNVLFNIDGDNPEM